MARATSPARDEQTTKAKRPARSAKAATPHVSTGPHAEAKPPLVGTRKTLRPIATKSTDAKPTPTRSPRGRARGQAASPDGAVGLDERIEVRRIHRRDLNRVWEFLKKSFRDVNRATVEYQRPRSKQRFMEIYEEDGVEQLVFTVGAELVAYAECTFEIVGQDNWLNPRYFEKRDMRPLYVEELAVHPDWNGRGVGSFVLEQLQHLARVRGLTHLVLEVAENNENALGWYKKRGFRKLDAAIFMAQSVDSEPELLPPRVLPHRRAGSTPT
jgi:ribosomal protein S18 acetylase RimI-like enzyme